MREEGALGPGFLSSSVGGRQPSWACMDFETLPCKTEPKPWDGWPPPSFVIPGTGPYQLGPVSRVEFLAISLQSCGRWEGMWTKWEGM